MLNIFAAWSRLDNRKRVVAILATLSLIATFSFLYQAATSPTMALLYAGLDAAAAAEIVDALEQNGSEFEIRGDAIYVDQTERDAIRLMLAGQSLPAGGPVGYELLDELSGFGTTSQMFDATFLRAREGELARTILATPGVRAARVHIAATNNKPFGAKGESTASVSVTLSQQALGAEHARAIRHLVAAAVFGLKPENVTIIDATSGAVLVAGENGAGAGQSASPAEHAERLRRGIERLLEARVGSGKAVVEVSVELETASESVVERSFDPERTVPVSTETEETSQAENGTGASNVTVASNLPDGNTSAGGQSNSNSTTIKERINYELSEMTRETIRNPGEIRRVTAAILIDGITSQDESGNNVWAPRSPEEIETFTALAKSAIGYSEDRGDVVTVTSLEFPAAEVEGTLAERSPFDLLAVNYMKLVQLSVLGLVALVLGLFVVRPILSSSQSDHLQLTAEPRALPEPIEAIAQIAGTAVRVAAPSDALGALRGFVTERSAESSKVLKGWIDPQQSAGSA